MNTLLYPPLHILACRTGSALYLSPPLPHFRHTLHAWAALVIRVVLGVCACCGGDT